MVSVIVNHTNTADSELTFESPYWTGRQGRKPFPSTIQGSLFGIFSTDLANKVVEFRHKVYLDGVFDASAGLKTLNSALEAYSACVGPKHLEL